VVSDLLPHVVNGVSLGLLFALIALGFMLILGVMEVINLAHGSLFALGAYLALTLLSRSRPGAAYSAWFAALPLGTRYALALVFAPLVVGLFGMVIELCLRRTYGKDPLFGLLFTFGAALVIEELIRVVWGHARLRAAATPGDFGEPRGRGPDLRQVPLFRCRIRAGHDRAPVAVHRAHTLRVDHSRPARTIARSCVPWASIYRG
jgi:branched-subunit amino acid ABC-type transport system permease component